MNIANRHFFFVTRIVSIIESENQSIFRQNFQYWQFHSIFRQEFSIEIIHFFREHCQNIFVFFIDRSYSLIFSIVSISISKIVRIFISIKYCNHFSHSEIFRFFIYLFSTLTFVFCFVVKFNIKSLTFKNFLMKFFRRIRNQHHLKCLKIFKNYIYFFINQFVFF